MMYDVSLLDGEIRLPSDFKMIGTYPPKPSLSFSNLLKGMLTIED